MRNFINKYKFLLIAILIIVVLVSYRFVRDYRLSKAIYHSREDEEYESIPRVIGVNEYVNVNMSEDTIVKMYFSKFTSAVKDDIESSYNKLDTNYAKAKFSDIGKYKEYMANLNIASAKVTKYNVIDTDDYKLYIVYDNRDNYYAFKVTGVLQYTVFLDDYTVEIR